MTADKDKQLTNQGPKKINKENMLQLKKIQSPTAQKSITKEEKNIRTQAQLNMVRAMDRRQALANMVLAMELKYNQIILHHMSNLIIQKEIPHNNHQLRHNQNAHPIFETCEF